MAANFQGFGILLLNVYVSTFAKGISFQLEADRKYVDASFNCHIWMVPSLLYFYLKKAMSVNERETSPTVENPFQVIE